MYSITAHEEGAEFSIDCDVLLHTDGTGLWSGTPAAVRVIGIHMFISEDGCGDLGVAYDEDTWDNRELGLIYTDKLFLAELRALLVKHGVPEEIAADVDYSEQGMQDDGRVSCDAYGLADWAIKLIPVEI